MIELEEILIKENLTFESLPFRIDDQKVQEQRGKTIPLVKIILGKATSESAAWKAKS